MKGRGGQVLALKTAARERCMVRKPEVFSNTNKVVPPLPHNANIFTLVFKAFARPFKPPQISPTPLLLPQNIVDSELLDKTHLPSVLTPYGTCRLIPVPYVQNYPNEIMVIHLEGLMGGFGCEDK